MKLTYNISLMIFMIFPAYIFAGGISLDEIIDDVQPSACLDSELCQGDTSAVKPLSNSEITAFDKYSAHLEQLINNKSCDSKSTFKNNSTSIEQAFLENADLNNAILGVTSKSCSKANTCFMLQEATLGTRIHLCRETKNEESPTNDNQLAKKIFKEVFKSKILNHTMTRLAELDFLNKWGSAISEADVGDAKQVCLDKILTTISANECQKLNIVTEAEVRKAAENTKCSHSCENVDDEEKLKILKEQYSISFDEHQLSIIHDALNGTIKLTDYSGLTVDKCVEHLNNSTEKDASMIQSAMSNLNINATNVPFDDLGDDFTISLSGPDVNTQVSAANNNSNLRELCLRIVGQPKLGINGMAADYDEIINNLSSEEKKLFLDDKVPSAKKAVLFAKKLREKNKGNFEKECDKEIKNIELMCKTASESNFLSIISPYSIGDEGEKVPAIEQIENLTSMIKEHLYDPNKEYTDESEDGVKNRKIKAQALLKLYTKYMCFDQDQHVNTLANNNQKNSLFNFLNKSSVNDFAVEQVRYNLAVAVASSEEEIQKIHNTFMEGKSTKSVVSDADLSKNIQRYKTHGAPSRGIASPHPARNQGRTPGSTQFATNNFQQRADPDFHKKWQVYDANREIAGKLADKINNATRTLENESSRLTNEERSEREEEIARLKRELASKIDEQTSIRKELDDLRNKLNKVANGQSTPKSLEDAELSGDSSRSNGRGKNSRLDNRTRIGAAGIGGSSSETDALNDRARSAAAARSGTNGSSNNGSTTSSMNALDNGVDAGSAANLGDGHSYYGAGAAAMHNRPMKLYVTTQGGKEKLVLGDNSYQLATEADISTPEGRLKLYQDSKRRNIPDDVAVVRDIGGTKQIAYLRPVYGRDKNGKVVFKDYKVVAVSETDKINLNSRKLTKEFKDVDKLIAVKQERSTANIANVAEVIRDDIKEFRQYIQNDFKLDQQVDRAKVVSGIIMSSQESLKRAPASTRTRGIPRVQKQERLQIKRQAQLDQLNFFTSESHEKFD